MVRSVKVFVERKTFSVRLEGEHGGTWCSITEHSRGSTFVLVEKGRQYKGESFSQSHVGPLHRSFAKVVSGEGPRGGGLVPIRRWARAVVCECIEDSVNWVEEALFLQDLRNLRVEGRISIQMRRWSSKENAEIERKFRRGWIELRGLPFHLWSEVSPPSFTRGDDGDWVFTVVVVVVGEEDFQRGSVKGESTREAFASNTGTGGGRRVEKIKSTTGGRCRVREDNRTRKGEKGSRKKKTTIVSKKLWSILLPPSSERRQGLRCRSEPLLSEKGKVDIDENPKVEALRADYLVERGSSASPLFSLRYPRIRKNRSGEGASTSKNEAALHNFYSNEYKEGF
ncbi:hypothetical protein CK203_039949 [Vitis vinifera]|uniref:DUF4283 domain-containing protein n=1 Tax=Vitis vinifera TaxID=29760 RepID=A0A438I2Y3_VITVI|nr:hypothetical protein CK203_039949 [Vitis vinifera]